MEGLNFRKAFVRLGRGVLPCLLAFGLQLTGVGLLGRFTAGEASRAAAGSILCVNPGGTGGCYDSIQAAINAASFGDVINVAAGTYNERVSLVKDGVSVHGQGWLNTIIDGGYSAAQPTVYISGVSRPVPSYLGCR